MAGATVHRQSTPGDGAKVEAEDRIDTWRTMDHPVHAVWAVQIKATGRLAGTLLLKSIPASGHSLPLQPSGDTEIGWHFHPDHWGHEYASEAAAAALEYAFTSGVLQLSLRTLRGDHPVVITPGFGWFSRRG